MKSASSVVAVLVVAGMIGSTTAVLGAADVSPLKVMAKGSAAASQYSQPSVTPRCRNLVTKHEQAEDRLAGRNAATRSDRRAADQREVRAARRKGASRAEIRRIQRANAREYGVLLAGHRASERGLDRRNDTAARARNCASRDR